MAAKTKTAAATKIDTVAVITEHNDTGGAPLSVEQLALFNEATCNDLIDGETFEVKAPLSMSENDLAYCAGEVSLYHYDTAPMKQGELCGVKYIAYDWVQSIAMSAKTSLSVIDLGDKRVYIGCDVSGYDKK